MRLLQIILYFAFFCNFSFSKLDTLHNTANQHDLNIKPLEAVEVSESTKGEVVATEQVHDTEGDTEGSNKFLHDEKPKRKDFYSYFVKDIRGKLVPLEKYRGTISLVVNVASECGFTDGHYKALVKAQRILGKNGRFNVLAFPCNQFGAQEPKPNEEIAKFAKDIYSVNFPIFAKINVLDKDVPIAWQYLINESGRKPNWNFYKYLVDVDGNVVKVFGPWEGVEDIFLEIKKFVDKAEASDITHEEL